MEGLEAEVGAFGVVQSEVGEGAECGDVPKVLVGGVGFFEDEDFQRGELREDGDEAIGMETAVELEVFDRRELEEDVEVGVSEGAFRVFEHGGAGDGFVGLPRGADPVVALGGEEFDAVGDEGVFELGFAMSVPAKADGVDDGGESQQGTGGNAEGGDEVTEGEAATSGEAA